MEVHRQRCQACGSTELHNVLRRREGDPQTVFVGCAKCGELVAVYGLAAYYHHGKGFESWVAQQRPGESARTLRDRYEKAQYDALEGWAEVREELERQGKALDGKS